MTSLNTRLNIEKLDENIIQKHRGSKQVGLKQLDSKQVGSNNLVTNKLGSNNLISNDDTAVAQRRLEDKQLEEKTNTDCLVKEQEKISNDDTAVAQRRLEDKQLEDKTNTDCLVKEQEKVHLGIKVGANITITGVPSQEGAEGNVDEKKKVKESMKANLRKLLKYKAWLTRRSPVRGSSIGGRC
nr:hypothetical protein [Tanacetum cinerariifolium]